MRYVKVTQLDDLAADIAAGKVGTVTHIQNDGTDVAVVLSPERYRELLMQGVPPNVRPEIVELMHESIRERGKVYEALAKLG